MMVQFQLNSVRVNGLDLHYLDVGSGDAIVFVHGGGATDYRTWMPVLDRFTDRYRVVVPSLRYHFPNAWQGDGSDYAPDTHARDLAALIEALALEPAHIVGSSLGANTGLVLARDHPGLVRTLVLAEPALPDWLGESATAPEREAQARAWEVIRQAAARGELVEAARRFADQVMGPGAFERMPEPARQRMVDNARILALPESAFNGARNTFTRQDARAIPAPTLLLRGDSSPKHFLLASDELAKVMPGTERALVPQAAHLLHGMNPEAFTEIVLAFLARH